MSNERKKTEVKIIAKPEPKKRGEVKTPVKKEPVKVEKVKRKKEKESVEDTSVPQIIPENQKELVIMTPSTPKTKRLEDKYIRIAVNASIDDRKLISERVLKGEIKFAYFAVDNDSAYHYYIINKTK